MDSRLSVSFSAVVAFIDSVAICLCCIASVFSGFFVSFFRCREVLVLDFFFFLSFSGGRKTSVLVRVWWINHAMFFSYFCSCPRPLILWRCLFSGVLFVVLLCLFFLPLCAFLSLFSPAFRWTWRRPCTKLAWICDLPKVYAVAKECTERLSPEDYGVRLGKHFLTTYPEVCSWNLVVVRERLQSLLNFSFSSSSSFLWRVGFCSQQFPPFCLHRLSQARR
jgi:hypothetical protein